MSLITPDKIRTFQRKLYCKAKAEPAFPFYVLYNKICREDILHHAYGLARATRSSSIAVDGVSFAQIEERGLEAWLAGFIVRQQLHEPVPEALASERMRQGVPRSRRCLCRRLRHPQSRSCGRGSHVDEGAVMTKLGLTLSEAKTSLRDTHQERFAFLGYSFGPHYP